MSGKLLPCPLCGCGEIVEYEPPGWPGGWTIACAACACSVARYDRNESRKSWNTRVAVTDEQFAQAVHDGRAWEPVRTCRNTDAVPDDGGFYPSPHFRCSECGASYSLTGYAYYCPNCGAKVAEE